MPNPATKTRMAKNLVCFLGPPAAGKGSYTRLVMDTFQRAGIPSVEKITTSDIIKQEIRKQTPEGLLMKAAFEKNEHVPTKALLPPLVRAINRSWANSIFLDGFPRNVTQAEEFMRACGTATTVKRSADSSGAGSAAGDGKGFTVEDSDTGAGLGESDRAGRSPAEEAIADDLGQGVGLNMFEPRLAGIFLDLKKDWAGRKSVGRLVCPNCDYGYNDAEVDLSASETAADAGDDDDDVSDAEMEAMLADFREAMAKEAAEVAAKRKADEEAAGHVGMVGFDEENSCVRGQSSTSGNLVSFGGRPRWSEAKLAEMRERKANPPKTWAKDLPETPKCARNADGGGSGLGGGAIVSKGTAAAIELATKQIEACAAQYPKQLQRRETEEIFLKRYATFEQTELPVVDWIEENGAGVKRIKMRGGYRTMIDEVLEKTVDCLAIEGVELDELSAVANGILDEWGH